jgi:hypothetical protein
MRSLELSASREILEKRIREKMLSVARNQKKPPLPNMDEYLEGAALFGSAA